jgi:hypothetical protein
LTCWGQKQALALAVKGIDDNDKGTYDRMSRWFGAVNSADAELVRERLVRASAFTGGATYLCETAMTKLGDAFA